MSQLCTDHDVTLTGVTTGDLHVEQVPCLRLADWRISRLDDPWPLQYACSNHLVTSCLRMGGDVHVQLLDGVSPTPPPRTDTASV